MIALAQQFFNITTTTEAVCQLFGISIRPHARVAIVTAEVTKEYLDVVEDGRCTEGMELRVSRGFDLKCVEERIRFVDAYVDLLHLLVLRKVSEERRKRKRLWRYKSDKALPCQSVGFNKCFSTLGACITLNNILCWIAVHLNSVWNVYSE
jgi:hypothetical protein